MKKVISLILSAVLLFTLFIPAAAAEATETVAYDGDPIVIVKGIDFSSLVKEDGSSAIALDPVDLLGLIFEIGGYKARGGDDGGNLKEGNTEGAFHVPYGREDGNSDACRAKSDDDKIPAKLLIFKSSEKVSRNYQIENA